MCNGRLFFLPFSLADSHVRRLCWLLGLRATKLQVCNTCHWIMYMVWFGQVKVGRLSNMILVIIENSPSKCLLQEESFFGVRIRLGMTFNCLILWVRVKDQG